MIAQAEVPFRDGFTAITGETGAGKSVLLKALRIVCGDKAQSTMVRTGEEKAVVEATFDIANEPQVKKVLEELEIDSDDELILRREIAENGKSCATHAHIPRCWTTSPAMANLPPNMQKNGPPGTRFRIESRKLKIELKTWLPRRTF